MRTEEETTEWINRYLTGQLDASGCAEIEQAIQQNTTFAALVQTHKTANDIILGSRLAQLKQMMDADFNTDRVERLPGTTSGWKIGGTLLITGLLCSVLYMYRTKSESVSGTPPHTIIQQPVQTSGAAGKETQVPHTFNHTPGGKTNHEIAASTEERPVQQTQADSVKTLPLHTILLPADPSHTNTATHVRLPADPCKGLVLSGKASSEAACTGKNDGSVTVSIPVMNAITAPFSYLLIQAPADTIRQSDNHFTRLRSGLYTVGIQDKNNCIGILQTIYVNEQACSKPKSYSFSPASGEVLPYPVRAGAEATIRIYSKAGVLIREEHILNGLPESWNGTNQNGQNIPATMYIYILEYTSGEQETGNIILY